MSARRCVIIGASPDDGVMSLKGLLRPDDIIVCADGGYQKAAVCGIAPDAIIGDFDSAPLPENINCEVIALPVKKDDTDTMYCIKEFVKRGCRDFLLSGMTGGRADHTFANYSALLYLAQHGMNGCIMDSSGSYYVIMENDFDIECRKNWGFGIFPFGCRECTVSLSGFVYEVSGYTLDAEMPIGVSNKIISDRASVCIHRGSALIMIYRQ